MKAKVRVASGQGFWGDWLEAPVRQVEGGPIDYLMMDYLAEITMSIMQKQRARDPEAGYARDLVPLMRRIWPACVERGIAVLTNAGGVNPAACRDGVLEAARLAGLEGKAKVGIVRGDDLMERLDDLIARGHALANMETAEPLETVRDRVQSANAYLGARPLVQALRQGAHVVVAGRTTDTALTYAPLIHEFGWRQGDWDHIAAGIVGGHINECGAQASGGNTGVDWPSIDYVDIGYPIIEAYPDGTFVVTKHEGTGGRVSRATVSEQLVYEMGDPREYITPDGVADFTTIRLEEEGKDRVRVHGIKGRPATDHLKVSISYGAGYKAVGSMVYSWPDAVDKARAADRTVRGRLERLGLRFDEIRTEILGAGACHGLLAGPPSPDLPEAQLRIGVRSATDRAAVERFTREIAPLVLAGPPTATGFAAGRPKVEEIVAYWPALIPKSEVEPHLHVEVTAA